MFIDDVIEKQDTPILKLNADATEAEADELKRQLGMLDATCPRYDVFNVHSTLNPKLITPAQPSPTVDKRNAEMIEKRNDLIVVAQKAPMGAPWYTFWLEHRYNDRQRLGYIVRYDKENRKYVGTMVFDSLSREGGIDFIPDAYEILLNDDDMFGGVTVKSSASAENDSAMTQSSELVRTVVELMNWDRKDVPVQTLSSGKPKSSGGGKNAGSKPRTDPTVIRFEPFVKHMKSHRSGGTGTSDVKIGEHMVVGHYMNVRQDHPLFGARPIIGKTFGRIKVKPHVRGNPQYGSKKAPTGIIVVGDVHDPNASQPVIPFPATGTDDKEKS